MFRQDAQKRETSFVKAGFQYNFCYKLKPSEEKLVVILPSAIDRKKYPNPPFYIRHRWFDDINHSVISVSDPMLYRSKSMTAGWMMGNQNFDCLYAMLDFFKEDSILSKYKERDIIFFGSSVGGFLALKAGSLWNESIVVCDMPQIELFNHHRITYESMLQCCFPSLTSEFIKKASSSSHFDN